MASFGTQILERNFDDNLYSQPRRLAPQTEPQKQQEPQRKNSLTSLNMLLISSVFLLLLIEACFYYHSVKVSTFANALQSEIIKTREQNYTLNVELAKTKELKNIEKMAISAYAMRSAENSEIKYLEMPKIVVEKDDLITKILPKDNPLSVPIGF